MQKFLEYSVLLISVVIKLLNILFIMGRVNCVFRNAGTLILHNFCPFNFELKILFYCASRYTVKTSEGIDVQSLFDFSFNIVMIWVYV
jgi:hypothetical protein